MAESRPMLSVLMPVYNAEQYLIESIESVLAQSYLDFEFIIINDGSCDNSEEIILGFPDARIRYFNNTKNLGVIEALNYGLQLARGKYVARMDADDIAISTRFERQIQYLEDNPEVTMVGSFIETIEPSPTIISYPTDAKAVAGELYFHCCIAHPTLMMRMKTIRSRGIFYPQVPSAEDYGLYMSLMPGVKIENIPAVLLRYRLHAHQISTRFSAQQAKSSRMVRESFFARLLSRPVDDGEASIHQKVCLGEKLNTEELRLFGSWIEKLVAMDPECKSALISRFNENARITIRSEGPKAVPVYWRFDYRDRNAFADIVFILIAILSWLKSSVLRVA